MRIGVIGAGAVGGAVSAVLARAGHDVEVTARGANLEAIRRNGIRLTGQWGDFSAAVSAGPALTTRPDLAVVATKAQDAAVAIGPSARWLAGTPVAVVQNGLESVRQAAPLLPDSQVVGALALFAASLRAPGEMAITTPGATYLGGGDPAATAILADALGAVIPVSVTDDFAGAQWSKLVVNQINALPAITGLSAQEVIADRDLRRIVTRSMRENVRVGLAAGVRFADLQGLSNGLLRAFVRAPEWAAQGLPLLMRRRMGPTPNPGSTQQSIRRGSLTEIDYLNGAVVTAAAAVGVPAPVNAALTDLVHRVERSGAFLTPAEVVAALDR